MKLDEIRKYYNLDFIKEEVIKLKTIDFKNKKSNYDFITFDNYKIQGMDLNILVSENYDMYIVCTNELNNWFVKNIEGQNEQDVIDYLNKELDDKEEMCFEVSGDRYLEIHRCDDGWDYTIYNKDFEDIDGGVLCNTEYNLLKALKVISEDFVQKELEFCNFKPIDYLEEI